MCNKSATKVQHLYLQLVAYCEWSKSDYKSAILSAILNTQISQNLIISREGGGFMGRWLSQIPDIFRVEFPVPDFLGVKFPIPDF